MQKLRKKSFMEAVWLLAIVGIFQLSGGLVLLYQARREAGQVPLDQFVATYTMLKTIYGCQVLLGVAFLALGFLVKHAPLKATAIGLGLYLAMNLGFAFLNPLTLTHGLLFKVFCIGGLMRAVQCARGYEKFQKQAVDAGAR